MALSANASAIDADGTDFNPQAWSELLRVFGPRGVDELVGVLKTDLPEQQRRFAAAVETSDLDALRRITHVLRGIGLQLGATDLADLCGRAESAARAGARALALDLGREVMARHAALVGRLMREGDAVPDQALAGEPPAPR